MRAISLFSGGGIGESRLPDIGVEVVLANELLSQRSNLFSALNPRTSLLVGDIRREEVKEKIAKVGKGIDFLIATPPCQGVSVAGTNRSPSSKLLDERNYLIFETVDLIRRTMPRVVILENVAGYLDLLLPLQGELVPIPSLLESLLGDEYSVKYKVVNAVDTGVAQDRKRAIIIMSLHGVHDFAWPSPGKRLTMREAIGHLPSLESGQDSGIEFHYARKHDPRHIIWMKNTPTGRTAFDNRVHFPKNESGDPIKAYRTTYRRMEWDSPATTITMRNDAISSQSNVHPGRLLSGGTYSDARVLTPLEILLLSSVEPGSLSGHQIAELEIRRAVGESVPPMLLNSIVERLI